MAEIMQDSINKRHWEKIAGGYSGNWMNALKAWLSRKETNHIVDAVRSATPQRVLDIGVGNGRILEAILAADDEKAYEVFGVDIAQEMVEFCKDKFNSEKRIKSLKRLDVSEQDISYSSPFDVVTAIRVLKYSKNWPEMLGRINTAMSPGGTLVFTHLNKRSFDRWALYPLPVYKTSIKELRRTLAETGFEVVDIRSFSKVPDFAYNYLNYPIVRPIIKTVETLLGVMFGPAILGRELFVICRKGNA